MINCQCKELFDALFELGGDYSLSYITVPGQRSALVLDYEHFENPGLFEVKALVAKYGKGKRWVITKINKRYQITKGEDEDEL